MVVHVRAGHHLPGRAATAGPGPDRGLLVLGGKEVFQRVSHWQLVPYTCVSSLWVLVQYDLVTTVPFSI